MRDSATVIRRGRQLAPDLAAALDGSDAGEFYAVHVQRLTPEDLAFFLETRAKVQEGLDDIKRGDVINAEDFYIELENEYGIKAR